MVAVEHYFFLRTLPVRGVQVPDELRFLSFGESIPNFTITVFWSLPTSHFALVVDVVHAVGEAPLQLRALRHVEARPAEENQFDGKLPYK